MPSAFRPWLSVTKAGLALDHFFVDLNLHMYVEDVFMATL